MVRRCTDRSEMPGFAEDAEDCRLAWLACQYQNITGSETVSAGCVPVHTYATRRYRTYCAVPRCGQRAREVRFPKERVRTAHGFAACEQRIGIGPLGGFAKPAGRDYRMVACPEGNYHTSALSRLLNLDAVNDW